MCVGLSVDRSKPRLTAHAWQLGTRRSIPELIIEVKPLDLATYRTIGDIGRGDALGAFPAEKLPTLPEPPAPPRASASVAIPAAATAIAAARNPIAGKVKFFMFDPFRNKMTLTPRGGSSTSGTLGSASIATYGDPLGAIHCA